MRHNSVLCSDKIMKITEGKKKQSNMQKLLPFSCCADTGSVLTVLENRNEMITKQ